MPFKAMYQGTEIRGLQPSFKGQENYEAIFTDWLFPKLSSSGKFKKAYPGSEFTTREYAR